MKKLRYPPKRRLVNEVYSLAAVLWIPAAVALVFPFSAFTFRIRSHIVVGIGSLSVANDFGINFCSSLFCMFIFF